MLFSWWSFEFFPVLNYQEWCCLVQLYTCLMPVFIHFFLVYMKMQWLCYKVCVYSVLGNTKKLFQSVWTQLQWTTAVHQDSLCSHPHQHVLSTCDCQGVLCFNIQFSDYSWEQTLFMFVGHSDDSFVKGLLNSLDHFSIRSFVFLFFF